MTVAYVESLLIKGFSDLLLDLLQPLVLQPLHHRLEHLALHAALRLQTLLDLRERLDELPQLQDERDLPFRFQPRVHLLAVDRLGRAPDGGVREDRAGDLVPVDLLEVFERGA